MLARVQALLSRWFYRSALEITAAQQEEQTGARPEWASNLKGIRGDDAFETIVQVRGVAGIPMCTVHTRVDCST